MEKRFSRFNIFSLIKIIHAMYSELEYEPDQANSPCNRRLSEPEQ